MSLTVMITDDSATARLIIQRCCEIAGLQDCTYLHAENGKKALVIMQDTLVDLILTDMNMPEMDGRELVKTIHDDPLTNHIPVIVITSQQNESLVDELRSLGATVVLPKPITPAMLARELTKIKW